MSAAVYTLPQPHSSIVDLAARSTPFRATEDQALWWKQRVGGLITRISSLFAALMQRFFKGCRSVGTMLASTIRSAHGQPEQQALPDVQVDAGQLPALEELALNEAVARVASLTGQQNGSLHEQMKQLESTKAQRFAMTTRLQSGFAYLANAQTALRNIESAITAQIGLDVLAREGLTINDVAQLVAAEDAASLARLGDPESLTSLVKMWGISQTEVVSLQEAIGVLSEYWLSFKLGTDDDLRRIAGGYGIDRLPSAQEAQRQAGVVQDFMEAFRARQAQPPAEASPAAVRMVESAYAEAVCVPDEGVLSVISKHPKVALTLPAEAPPADELATSLDASETDAETFAG